MSSILFVVLLRGSALVALGAVAGVMARNRSAALRHGIWCAVLVAIAALPFLQSHVPAWRIPIAATAAPVTRMAATAPLLVTESATASQRALPSPTSLLVFAWAAVAALLLTRLVLAHRRLRGLALRAQPVERGVYLSGDIAIPIVVGLRHPRVLLPASSLDWTPACRRGVILHELAHVRRGDLWWLTFARAMSAVLWFHPLVHFACARLRVEAERASDDAVLRGGEAPSRYAQMLLDFSARVGATRLAAGIPLLRREHLSERIESIVEANRSHAALGALSKLAFIPAVLVGILVVAAPQFGRAAEPPASDWIQGKVVNQPGQTVKLLGVRARLMQMNPNASVLDSPELALQNNGKRAIHSLYVRLVTRSSTDQFWCSVSLAPGARATLRIPAAQWSNEGTAAELSTFQASVTDARETGAPQEAAGPAPIAGSDRVPAQVFHDESAPVAVENAATPRDAPKSDSDLDHGHDLTYTPGFDLRNTGAKTIESVRIRYKADAESHAVTVIHGPIAPGQTLAVAPGRSMWGKPEAMTIQVLGVRFTDGSSWGSLNSTIDTRQAWIR